MSKAWVSGEVLASSDRRTEADAEGRLEGTGEKRRGEKNVTE